MYVVIEIPDDKAFIAQEMFGKDVSIIHEPDAGWLIYGGRVIALSLDNPVS